MNTKRICTTIVLGLSLSSAVIAEPDMAGMTKQYDINDGAVLSLDETGTDDTVHVTKFQAKASEEHADSAATLLGTADANALRSFLVFFSQLR